MVNVNCRAAMGVTNLCLPYLTKGSRVLEICSTASFQPLPGLGVYAATKAFLYSYTKALHHELLFRGVHVTAVCPYWVKDTEFIPVARAGKAKQYRHFPLASRSPSVVRLSLAASAANLWVVTPGLVCSVHRIAAKCIPHALMVPLLGLLRMYGDNVIEKHGINRDRTGDREKTRYLCGKQGIFTRDRALIRPGFIRQLETRASTRSASFFHALGSPGRPHNGGGAAGAYRTRNGAKPLKQGHLRAKRGPLGPSRKSQQQTKRTGFAAHGHSIAETAPEGKRASRANGALIRA